MQMSHLGGEDAPRPHRGTLTPFIPLSLRAFKGEGERITEAEVGAKAPTSASSSVLGRGRGEEVKGVSGQVLDSSRGIGMTVRRVGGWQTEVTIWRGVGHPPLILRGPQHERPHGPGNGTGLLPTPDSSRGIGMTGEKGVVGDGGMRRVGKAWASPPLILRVASARAAPRPRGGDQPPCQPQIPRGASE